MSTDLSKWSILAIISIFLLYSCSTPERACSKGDGNACFYLAEVEKKQRNKELAALYWQKACDLNHLEACNHFAYQQFRLGKIVSSMQAYKRSCTLGHGYGCSSLGKLRYKYEKKESAIIYFRKACELKDSYGCTLLAVLEEDLGEHKEAQKYYQQACDLELQDEDDNHIPDYCFLAGDFFARISQKKLAGEYFNKACQLRPKKADRLSFSAQGCARAGIYLNNESLIQKGLDYDDRLCNRHGTIGVAECYDAACIHSMRHNISLAFEYAEKAFKKGWNNWEHLKSDYELDTLKREPRFRELLLKYLKISKEKAQAGNNFRKAQ